MEESGFTEGDMNCGSLAQAASKEKKISIWPRDCSYVILEKNVAFCPFPKIYLGLN